MTLTPKNGPYYKVGFWSGDYKNHIIAYKATSHDAYYAEIGYDYKMEEAGIDLTVAFTWAPDMFVNSGHGRLQRRVRYQEDVPEEEVRSINVTKTRKQS